MLLAALVEHLEICIESQVQSRQRLRIFQDLALADAIQLGVSEEQELDISYSVHRRLKDRCGPVSELEAKCALLQLQSRPTDHHHRNRHSPQSRSPTPQGLHTVQACSGRCHRGAIIAKLRALAVSPRSPVVWQWTYLAPVRSFKSTDRASHALVIGGGVAGRVVS